MEVAQYRFPNHFHPFHLSQELFSHMIYLPLYIWYKGQFHSCNRSVISVSDISCTLQCQCCHKYYFLVLIRLSASFRRESSPRKGFWMGDYTVYFVDFQVNRQLLWRRCCVLL